MADSLKLFEAPKTGTFPEEQARAVTLAIRESESETRDWVRHEFELFEEKIERRFDALEARFDAKLAELESRLIRWMFVFWIGQMATTVGLVFAAFKLFR